MKTIELKSRYGGVHKLIPSEKENVYIFQTAEEWMPYSLIGEQGKIMAIDPEGGPMIAVGSEINGMTVRAITESDKGILIEVC